MQRGVADLVFFPVSDDGFDLDWRKRVRLAAAPARFKRHAPGFLEGAVRAVDGAFADFEHSGKPLLAKFVCSEVSEDEASFSCGDGFHERIRSFRILRGVNKTGNYKIKKVTFNLWHFLRSDTV